MLATSERVRGDGGRTEVLVWHKPVGRCIMEGGHHEQVRGGFVVGTRVHRPPAWLVLWLK